MVQGGTPRSREGRRGPGRDAAAQNYKTFTIIKCNTFRVYSDSVVHIETSTRLVTWALHQQNRVHFQSASCVTTRIRIRDVALGLVAACPAPTTFAGKGVMW